MNPVRQPLNLVLLALVIIVTLAGFLLIAADRLVPVHWQLSGQVDTALPRNYALLQMPIATIVIWILAYAIHRWGNTGRGAQAAAVIRLIIPGLTTLFLAIQLLIVLVLAGRGDDRLLQDHLEHRAGEEQVEVLAVDGDLARAGLHPDAGNGVLALAGGVGAALLVELLHVDRSGRLRGDRSGAEVFERVDGLGHYSALTFLEFMAATSSFSGDCASCGCLSPA